MTTTNEQRAHALAIIRDMRAQGHAYNYIATALTRAGVPTLSGRAGTKWDRKAVFRLAQEAQ